MKSKPTVKTVKDRVILRVDAMEFEKGKIYAVMGSNGSGKSTFAKHLALGNGLENPFSEEKELVIGYMPQNSFAYRLSVLKNVMLTAPKKEDAIAMLTELGMEPLLDNKAKKLSGGETAKLALARVLVKAFDILVLDEPTAAMDTESTYTAEKLIKQYSETNRCPVVVITHSIGQAQRLADELIFFYKGKILEQGPVAEVLNHPKTEEATAFFAM